MKLYGTLTSPYVRRVRIVAQMVGAPLELINTFTEEGQNALRTISPIWKIPVLDGEDKAIYDSRVIINYLIRRFGNRNIRTESGSERWREQNLISVIDGALDSLINVFYLKRDGADPSSTAYLQKQEDRADSCMSFVEKQLEGGYLTEISRVGLGEIALVTTLDWMQFRKTYPVDRHPGLVDFLEHHAGFEPFVSTRPEG